MQTILFCEQRGAIIKVYVQNGSRQSTENYISRKSVFIACANKKFAYWMENRNAMNIVSVSFFPCRREWIYFLFYYYLDIGSSLRVYGNPIYSPDSNWLVYTVKSNVIGPFIKTSAIYGMDKRKQFNYTKDNIVYVYVIAISASVFHCRNKLNLRYTLGCDGIAETLVIRSAKINPLSNTFNSDFVCRIIFDAIEN